MPFANVLWESLKAELPLIFPAVLLVVAATVMLWPADLFVPKGEKRRWAGADWESLEKAALENWLLNRLEAIDLWPRDAHPAPRLRSVRELVDALSGNEDFRRALDLYAGTGSDAHATVATLVQQASVPPAASTSA